jgi:hypothetical protein
VLTDRLVTTFTEPTPLNITLAVLLLAGLLVLSFALSRVVTQRQRARARRDAQGASTNGSSTNDAGAV